MTSLKTTVAAMLLSVFASTASADFNIDWQGTVQRLPGNPVSDRWQLGIVPHDGMSISSWCASRFGNGYECVDEVIALNRIRLEQFTCGGENWLCAGRGYLFPAGTYAVQTFTQESPDEETLMRYLEKRFDRQGNELASQFEAIQAVHAQLLAGQSLLFDGQTQQLKNQTTMMKTDQEQSAALATVLTRVGTVEDEVNKVKTTVTANNDILNLLVADMGLTGTAGTSGSNNSQDTQVGDTAVPTDVPPPPPTEPTWWQTAWNFVIDWLPWLVILTAVIIWWFKPILPSRVKTSSLDNGTESQTNQTPAAGTGKLTFIGDAALPDLYNQPKSWTVKKPDGTVGEIKFIHRQKKGIDTLYSWSLDQLPEGVTSHGDGRFIINDPAHAKKLIQQAYEKGWL